MTEEELVHYQYVATSVMNGYKEYIPELVHLQELHGIDRTPKNMTGWCVRQNKAKGK